MLLSVSLQRQYSKNLPAFYPRISHDSANIFLRKKPVFSGTKAWERKSKYKAATVSRNKQ
jgi:hypothetical protein